MAYQSIDDYKSRDNPGWPINVIRATIWGFWKVLNDIGNEQAVRALFDATKSPYSQKMNLLWKPANYTIVHNSGGTEVLDLTWYFQINHRPRSERVDVSDFDVSMYQYYQPLGSPTPDKITLMSWVVSGIALITGQQPPASQTSYYMQGYESDGSHTYSYQASSADYPIETLSLWDVSTLTAQTSNKIILDPTTPSVPDNAKYTTNIFDDVGTSPNIRKGLQSNFQEYIGATTDGKDSLSNFILKVS